VNWDGTVLVSSVSTRRDEDPDHLGQEIDQIFQTIEKEANT
jgi:hypothetical protein